MKRWILVLTGALLPVLVAISLPIWPTWYHGRRETVGQYGHFLPALRELQSAASVPVWIYDDWESKWRWCAVWAAMGGTVV